MEEYDEEQAANEPEKHSALVKGVDKASGIKEDDMNVMFVTNVTGLISMTQAILPIILKRNNGDGSGKTIKIGSIAGVCSIPSAAGVLLRGMWAPSSDPSISLLESDSQYQP